VRNEPATRHKIIASLCLCAAAATLAACSSDGDSGGQAGAAGAGAGGPGGQGGQGGALEVGVPIGPCMAVVEQHPIEGAQHLANCSPVAYATNPPSSGNHYGTWAAFKTYAQPVPEGFFVHSLEHGAVVFTYNCADGCPDQVAAAQALIDAAPADPLCEGTSQKARLILTPDPRLDTAFAASAWGWTIKAACFDAEVFGAFLGAHYGQGTEALCNDGTDVFAEGLTAGCP
jgi:hypothetical protein